MTLPGEKIGRDKQGWRRDSIGLQIQRRQGEQEEMEGEEGGMLREGWREEVMGIEEEEGGMLKEGLREDVMEDVEVDTRHVIL